MTGLPLGSIFGVRLYLHWSFSLLLAWVGYRSYVDSGLSGAVFSVVLVCALFVCVVLHELGHSLAARKFGVPTHSITLYPIGGVARLAFMPRNPRHELVIALAGPAVNVLIAILLSPLLFLTGLPPWDANGELLFHPATFLTALIAYNVIMILFNLIPAFPMDGGRVLRALIAWNGRYSMATTIAARLGQSIALLFIVTGTGVLPISGFHPTLLLIGVFIFLAAESERRMAARAIPPPPPPSYVPFLSHPVRTVIVPPEDWEIHPR